MTSPVLILDVSRDTKRFEKERSDWAKPSATPEIASHEEKWLWLNHLVIMVVISAEIVHVHTRSVTYYVSSKPTQAVHVKHPSGGQDLLWLAILLSEGEQPNNGQQW